jgi:hypothetical protein
MVTQITLNTEPHGFGSCQGHSYEKLATNRGTFVVPGPGRSGVALVTLDETNGPGLASLTSRCVRARLSSLECEA